MKQTAKKRTHTASLGAAMILIGISTSISKDAARPHPSADERKSRAVGTLSAPAKGQRPGSKRQRDAEEDELPGKTPAPANPPSVRKSPSSPVTRPPAPQRPPAPAAPQPPDPGLAHPPAPAAPQPPVSKAQPPQPIASAPDEFSLRIARLQERVVRLIDIARQQQRQDAANYDAAVKALEKTVSDLESQLRESGGGEIDELRRRARR